MSHEIYINEQGTASMAYVGATPWHGLGQLLTPDSPIEVWAEQAGMNFSINKAPVRFKPEGAGAKAKHVEVPGRVVLHRSDTDEPLGVTSSRYQVVQPEQILSFFNDTAEMHGFTLETAGVMFRGQKYWALARTPYEYALPGQDIIKPYLLLATSCDGTMSTVARYVNTRVVCNNTIEMALGEGGQSIRVTHRQKFDEVSVKRELGLLEEAFEDQVVKIQSLANRTVTAQEAVDYFIKVLGNPEQPIDKQRNVGLLAKVHALFDGGGIGASMESYKGTAWGLVSAVTEYVDHQRGGTKDDGLDKDRRLESAWFYEGSSLKRKAMNDALMLLAA